MRNGPTGAPFNLSTWDLLQVVFDIGHMVIALIRSRRKADTKRGENPILGKHVLVELRQVNHFFDDFCLKTLYLSS